jgi:hypothetical protein
MTDPHSDYMLGNDMRVAILQDAKRYGVQWAAKMHRVSENSIYKWRKVPALAAQVTGGVMTDSDLISGLREWKPWRHEDFYMVKAADRIEALTAKVKLMDDLDVINGEKIEALTAKLAKAVELALEECPFRAGTPKYDKWWHHRRATLAEIKGGNDAKSDL